MCNTNSAPSCELGAPGGEGVSLRVVTNVPLESGVLMVGKAECGARDGGSLLSPQVSCEPDTEKLVCLKEGKIPGS